MKDRDEIKELFQKELGNYEAKVDPNLWQGIQSGISSSAATTSAAISTVSKVAITVISAAIVTIASIVVYNSLQNDVESKDQSLTQNRSINEQVDERKSPEKKIKNNKSITIVNSEPKDKKQESTESTSSEAVSQESKEIIYETFDRDDANQKNNDSRETNKETTPVFTQKETKEYVDTQNHIAEKEEKTMDEKVSIKFTPVIRKQENQYVVFSLEDTNVQEVVWDFGDGDLSTQTNPEHFYDESGTYIVNVKGRIEDQELEKTIKVIVDIEGEISKLPNSFTPNGDGRNDYLFVESKGLKELQITIMNNKQEVVYQSNNINFKWDGNNQNGTPAPEGNYVYIIVAKDNQDNTLNNYQQLHLSR